VVHLDGILLAAGESRRMGYPKPLLKIGGLTFVETVAQAMLTVVPHLVIVLGAYAERIRPVVPHDDRIAVVVNSDCMRGQLSSLKIGLDEVAPAAQGVLVHLCDHPMVRVESFIAVVAAYERLRSPIVIARCAGKRGHPLVFDRSLFAELADAPENRGARHVVNADPARVAYVDLDDPGINLDLDTAADLARAGLEMPPGAR
jgi:molybdenum cofactor cytidylyltransferase